MTDLQQRIVSYKQTHPKASSRTIGKIFGCSSSTVIRALNSNQSNQKCYKDLGEQSGIVEIQSTKIKTIEEALAYAEIDTDVWLIDRCVTNHWDTTIKQLDGMPKVVTNYQIKIHLKRKVVPDIEKALGLINTIKPVKVKQSQVKGDNWAFIGLYDSHFGKLAWQAETGENCDLKITKSFYLNAIADTLERIKPYKVGHIVYPIGQDFLHINNAANTTANDTKQDVDGRLIKVYLTAFECAILGIEMCLKVAPVEVIYISSNHDRETSWFLAHAIQQRLGNQIKVDLEPIKRKYRSFGSCLVGMSHAETNRERNRLHNLMAVEQRSEWSKAKCCEWLTGHFHKRGEERITTIDSGIMQTIRVLPSLSGRDKWHYDNAFISPRACETYLYSPYDGYIGHVSTNPRRK